MVLVNSEPTHSLIFNHASVESEFTTARVLCFLLLAKFAGLVHTSIPALTWRKSIFDHFWPLAGLRGGRTNAQPQGQGN